MKQSCGILYVATKLDRYVEEAFLSADSVKQRYPGLHVTLFTDRDSNPLCATDCFDRVEAVDSVAGFGSDWAEGQLNRLKALARTPYERTLNLDTDTRVFSRSLPQLFDLLDEIDVAMVEDPPDNSYARRLSGRAMFNAGFILYRKSDRISKWLSAWTERTEQHFSWALQTTLPSIPYLDHVADEETRRNLLRIDQIAMMESLSPDRNSFGLSLKTLDPSWNYRGSRLDAYYRKSVDILHSHAFKKTMPDLLATAERWAGDRRNEDAERLYSYVAAAQPPAAARRSKTAFGFGRPVPPVAAPARREPNQSVIRGNLHLRYGQWKSAARCFRAALERNADDVDALLGCALVALREGRLAEALTYAEDAVRRAPSEGPANSVYGEILLASGQAVDAIAPLTVAQKGGDAQAAFLLGQAWFKLKNYRKAATAYESALSLDPEHGAAANNYLSALLGRGKYAATVTHADQLLKKRPWHVPALAFKCLALSELKRNDEVEAIVDIDRFVKTEKLGPPSGFDSIDDFNRAVARMLADEPSLIYEPPSHTTRFGQQSGNIAEHGSKIIQTLNTMILNAVSRRILEMPKRGTHPFDLARPQNYRLHSWVTILDEQGHQTPHMHASGWLSGVYYVEVPEAVMADTQTEQGWLVFGPGDERWQRPGTTTIERAVGPSPGLLVTFPSFFWHKTRPLRIKARRISYAFDIVPD